MRIKICMIQHLNVLHALSLLSSSRVVKMNCLQASAGSSSSPWPLTHCYWCCIKMRAISPAVHRIRMMVNVEIQQGCHQSAHLLQGRKNWLLDGVLLPLPVDDHLGALTLYFLLSAGFMHVCGLPIDFIVSGMDVHIHMHTDAPSPLPVSQPVSWVRLWVWPQAYMCENKCKSRALYWPPCLSIYSYSQSFVL